MTRTHAPADHPAMDLALREAAEQWRLDFEVPPMPLLDGDPQRLEAPAPARPRWTRPVMVAASIMALGAVTAAVISVARPTDQVADSSSSAVGPTSAASGTHQLKAWPAAQAGGPLVVQVGSPPPSIVLGGTTMALLSTASPPWVVVDSERPNFVRIFGDREVGGDCGSATRLYLDQSATGTVTVTSASYGPDLAKQTCIAMHGRGEFLDAEAPFAMAGQHLISGPTGAPVQTVDLADYRAPQYVPQGFTLSPWINAQSIDGSPQQFFVRRAVIPSGGPNGTGISLMWHRAGAKDPLAAVRPSWSQVDLCASRVLPGGISVSACDMAQDPRQTIAVAELQRVVDSVPS